MHPRVESSERIIYGDNEEKDGPTTFLYQERREPRKDILVMISALRFAGHLDGFVGVAEFGQVLARHQIVIHAAAEVFLGDVAAHRALIAILGEAAHILDHGEFATAVMI